VAESEGGGGRTFLQKLYEYVQPEKAMCLSHLGGGGQPKFRRVPPLDHGAVEPYYKEPLFDKDPAITNDILQSSNSKIYGKVLRYNELLLPVLHRGSTVLG